MGVSTWKNMFCTLFSLHIMQGLFVFYESMSYFCILFRYRIDDIISTCLSTSYISHLHTLTEGRWHDMRSCSRSNCSGPLNMCCFGAFFLRHIVPSSCFHRRNWMRNCWPIALHCWNKKRRRPWFFRAPGKGSTRSKEIVGELLGKLYVWLRGLRWLSCRVFAANSWFLGIAWSDMTR